MSKQENQYHHIHSVLHGVLVGLHQGWEVFCSAARKTNQTPAEAEATLLARILCENLSGPPTPSDWCDSYINTSYVQWAVGRLSPEREKKLDSLYQPGTGSWKEDAVKELKVEREFIRRLYGVCTEWMMPETAIEFILRGLGAEANPRCFEQAKSGGE